MKKYNNVFIKNIYYMLSYAFKALNQKTFEKIEQEEFHHIHDLFGAILAKGIGVQLKQGLYREYLDYNEHIPVLRGKLEMSGTIQNIVAQKRLLHCNYDQLSENNLLNQILKATALLLIRHGEVKADTKDELKKQIFFFSQIDELDPTSIRWSSLSYHRNNNTYRMLMQICRFVIDGMLLTTESGEYRLAAFEDSREIHRLYEAFILEYYRKEHPSLSAKSAMIEWALDDDEKSMLPTMQSDVILTDGHKTLIIDAKFYARTTQRYFDAPKIHSSNLYQIFTYVKNQAAKTTNEVAGLILYAHSDEAIHPSGRFMMSGNPINVQTLDLNCDFSIIAKQLDLIVQQFFAEVSA